MHKARRKLGEENMENMAKNVALVDILIDCSNNSAQFSVPIYTVFSKVSQPPAMTNHDVRVGRKPTSWKEEQQGYDQSIKWNTTTNFKFKYDIY